MRKCRKLKMKRVIDKEQDEYRKGHEMRKECFEATRGHGTDG